MEELSLTKKPKEINDKGEREDEFSEFKKKYSHQYRWEFFKNPFSKMKRMLECNVINSMEEVEAYAKNNPNSRVEEITGIYYVENSD